MTARKGFTLIEVMVALVLTGLVALLAYGSAQAGFDTADRLDDYRHGTESEALMRGMVADALRHVADAPAGGPPSFRIERTGLSSDALTFVTRGVTSPHGAGTLWMMSLRSSVQGLWLHAEPLEDAEAADVDAYVSGVTGISVRARSDDGDWVSGWATGQRAPAAVEISFVGSRSPIPTLLVASSRDLR